MLKDLLLRQFPLVTISVGLRVVKHFLYKSHPVQILFYVVINLLAPDFFLILAHPVYKM